MNSVFIYTRINTFNINVINYNTFFHISNKFYTHKKVPIMSQCCKLFLQYIFFLRICVILHQNGIIDNSKCKGKAKFINFKVLQSSKNDYTLIT